MTPDDFEDRLRAALDATPAPAQLARLEQFWRDQSRSDRGRVLVRRVLAAAAAIAVATVSLLLCQQREILPTAPPRSLAQESGAREHLDPPRPAANDEAPQIAAAGAASPSRPPTAVERIVFTVRTSQPLDVEKTLLGKLGRETEPDERHKIIQRLAQLEAPRSGLAVALKLLAYPSGSTIDEFLALAADPASRSDALAAARAVDSFPLDDLLDRLDAPEKSQRLAAAILLGQLGDVRVGRALIARVTQAPRASVEAWVALLACPGREVDAFLASAARRPQVLGQVNNARAYWARMTP